MKLYLIRHGESVNNLKGCFTGQMDVPLTEKGISDAEKAGKILKNKKFDKVYTSDLLRAKKTAEITLPGCTYEETELLREINVGNLAGNSISLCEEKYGEQLVHAKAIRDYTAFGGENFTELRKRMEKFMKKLESSDCRNIAAFSHAGILNAMLELVLKVQIPSSVIKCPNCTIAVFEYRNEAWKLAGWIDPKLINC